MQFVNAWTKEMKYVFEWLMKRMTTFDLILYMCMKLILQLKEKQTESEIKSNTLSHERFVKQCTSKIVWIEMLFITILFPANYSKLSIYTYGRFMVRWKTDRQMHR